MNPNAILALILQYRYPILVPAALIWGLMVGMLVGVVVRLGALELLPAYACIMLGELIGDMLWYGIGFEWGEGFVKRFGRYVGLDDSAVAAARNLFQKHDQRILFASKLTTGFGFAIPILFTAGMTRMSFLRYMSANLTGQFLWSGGLIAVGYFFGDWYLRVNNIFEKATVVSIGIILVGAGFGFAKYLGRRILAQPE
jgi:membrane-associated protein